jgi:hypothetical protein
MMSLESIKMANEVLSSLGIEWDMNRDLILVVVLNYLQSGFGHFLDVQVPMIRRGRSVHGLGW